MKNILSKYTIYNAATDGKTTRGYVNDFLYWFPKIPNFKPDYFIFYSGINDRRLGIKEYELESDKYDFKFATKPINQIRDYIKSLADDFRAEHGDLDEEIILGKLDSDKDIRLDSIASYLQGSFKDLWEKAVYEIPTVENGGLYKPTLEEILHIRMEITDLREVDDHNN